MHQISTKMHHIPYIRQHHMLLVHTIFPFPMHNGAKHFHESPLCDSYTTWYFLLRCLQCRKWHQWFVFLPRIVIISTHHEPLITVKKISTQCSLYNLRLFLVMKSPTWTIFTFYFALPNTQLSHVCWSQLLQSLESTLNSGLAFTSCRWPTCVHRKEDILRINRI